MRSPSRLVPMGPLLGALLVSGCAPSSTRAPPELALASGAGAQAEFRALRANFFDADTAGRVALLAKLREFLARRPLDERALAVRIYAAWSYLESGEREAARTVLAPVLRGPNGATRDFARVAAAAILAREGQASKALVALQSLDGRIVDLDERFVYGEERTRAAFAAGEGQLGVQAVLAWLSQAPPDRLERARGTARTLLGLVPARELTLALKELARDPKRKTSAELEGGRVWLRTTIVERLTRLALERRDADLARRVLEAAPAALRATPDGQRLVELSTSGPKKPAIAGRAVGLLLALGDATKRRRSAAVVAGVTRALGSARTTDQRDVEVLVRSGTNPVEAELAELAAEGAGLFVAGLDDEMARRASAYAEVERIPVLLLRPLPAQPSAAGYSFVLGLDDGETESALGEALLARGRSLAGRVGPRGVSCDVEPAAPGAFRFPIAEWQKTAAAALFVAGDAACARELALEVRSARAPFWLALGLDGSEAYATLGIPTLVIRAGDYPVKSPAGGWYEALGHDAALLAARALEALPRRGLVRGESVEALHERTRDALGRAEAELWTSEARGFAGARRLPRKLSVVTGGTTER